MVKKRTKKQKIKTKKRLLNSSNIEVSETGLVSINSNEEKTSKIKSTTFSESQVSLLKKDLMKTLITTLIVFSILILIHFNFK